MKQVVCLLLCGTIFLAGCAGRDGNPVSAYKPGDEKRNCISLQTEMSQIDTEIASLTPKANKGPWNTLMLVTGLFVIVPLFFMDLKNGEKTELEAYKQRRNSLSLIAAQKGCVIADAAANAAVSQPDGDFQGKKIVGYQTAGKDANGKPIVVPVYE